MKPRKLLCYASFLFYLHSAFAGSPINTNGSADGVAIGGFDSVAFFSEKRAVQGKKEFSFEWMGATWIFASQENLNLFKANPEKYMPQYGGHCSYGASEGYISKKPANGMFEFVDGKLYLFPDGTNRPNGARQSWWDSGGGPQRRIAAGDLKWPKLKEQLESR